MAWRWRRHAVREVGYAISRAAYAREVRTLVPEVADEDLVPAFAGVRAQAVGRDGALLDDFVLEGSAGVLHVRNAPSPAATAALAIAGELADRAGLRSTAGAVTAVPSATMRILVTGASGAIGAALAPELARAGHEVRAFARDPARVTCAGVDEIVTGDAVTGAGLDAAVDGADVVYHLIHSMERAGRGGASFPERERRTAANVVAACERAGVRRVVYLGGLVPADHAASPHLASRLAVEDALLGAAPEAVALRASIVISAALALVPVPRAPGRALPRPPAAGLARPPHPADRRARRHRLPRRRRDLPQGRGRHVARHRGPGRHDLRRDRAADRRRAARAPAADRAAVLR